MNDMNLFDRSIDNDKKQVLLEEEAKRVISYFKEKADSDNIMSLMDFSLVSCDAANREVRLRFPIKKWQLNPNQALHGGLLATSFDIAFGLLVRILTKHDFISTVDLSVKFLKPIWVEDEVVIVAKANHEGKTIIQLSAEAFVKDVMVGTSSATFIQMKR